VEVLIKVQRHHLFWETLSVRQAVVGLLHETPRRTGHPEKFIFGFTDEWNQISDTWKCLVKKIHSAEQL